MTTPIDQVIAEMTRVRFHNHRSEAHSDIISHGIWNLLLDRCPAISTDFERDKIDFWTNVEVPGLTHRIDMMVCEVGPHPSTPSLERARICLENKTVITAHGKNRRNRHSDLSDFYRLVQSTTPEAIVLGTVLIGTAEQYLNIPDSVRPACKLLDINFETDVLPRLSSGDESLWDQFRTLVGQNRSSDAAKTVELMRSLPTRPRGFTHETGFDYLWIVPLRIDNVSAPRVVRQNEFAIDIDGEFEEMIDTICRRYTSRWSP
ncbi:MAG: hypothetical protein IT332_10730 [Ardenticatenales bacterium]|nr:hypothetical protein [Ardenticatenales bacterium]